MREIKIKMKPKGITLGIQQESLLATALLQGAAKKKGGQKNQKKAASIIKERSTQDPCLSFGC